jgi:hypothetical protein
VLANAVRRRAQRHPVRVAPGLLPELFDDARVVLGGADAALAIAPVGKPMEHVMYVKESNLKAIREAFFVVPAADSKSNVVLCAVDDAAWMLDNGGVSLAGVVVDLLDQGDVRSAAEVLRLIA